MGKSDSKYRNDRSAVAAQFIKPNTSVLDMGCGMMLIREHLPENVSYIGYDIVAELPETHLIDLDAHEFPEGQWDYVILLGVLPWIKERAWTLDAARKAGKFLIVTRKDDRFDAEIEKAGWIFKEKLPHVEPVHVCLYARQ